MQDGLQGFFGDKKDDKEIAGTLQSIAKNNLSIDIPSAPTFGLNSVAAATFGTLSIQFYLINKTTEWLDRNFKFLHAFYAGTQWLQMTGRID